MIAVDGDLLVFAEGAHHDPMDSVANAAWRLKRPIVGVGLLRPEPHPFVALHNLREVLQCLLDLLTRDRCRLRRPRLGNDYRATEIECPILQRLDLRFHGRIVTHQLQRLRERRDGAAQVSRFEKRSAIDGQTPGLAPSRSICFFRKIAAPGQLPIDWPP
jgi:hypothetical protein